MERVVLANFAIQLLSIFILLTTKNAAFLYVYSILAGFSVGAIYSAAPTVLGAYYQKEYYVRALSILALLQTSFLAAGAFVGGVIYDATSSYNLDFFVLAAFCIVGLVSVAAIPAQRKRELEVAD